MAYRPPKDIKGYHNYNWPSSKSFIGKSYDGYNVSPVISEEIRPVGKKLSSITGWIGI